MTHRVKRFVTLVAGLSTAAHIAVSRAAGPDRDRFFVQNPAADLSTIDATYPITVDPVFEEAKLTASAGKTGDLLGYSIASSGDTLVVATPFATVGSNVSQGAVYIFQKPSGGWATTSTISAKLTASDGKANDAFGSSVAISGDTVVVGAPDAKIGSNLLQGAAYVFVRPSTGWATTSNYDARLTTSDGASEDELGSSVAVSGITVVSGAPNARIGSNGGGGAAYVFVKPSGGWATSSAFNAKLTALDGAAADILGFSVAIDGDTVVTGDANAQVGTNSEQGAAYIFVMPSSGWATTSAFDAKLTAPDGLARDGLGYSVAVSADTVVAGAPNAAVTSNSKQGAAYVAVKPPGGWAKASAFDAKLTAADGTTNSKFGYSVAVAGNTVLAGAPFATVSSDTTPGAAYAFFKSIAGWETTSAFDMKLAASDGAALGAFGFSIAESGDTIFVSAPNETVGSNASEGAVYLYSLPNPLRPVLGLEGAIIGTVSGR